MEIRGLGTFKVKPYEGYQGRNPRTGELVEVSPKRLPCFRMGRELKLRVNGEPSPPEREEANPKAVRSQRQRHATQTLGLSSTLPECIAKAQGSLQVMALNHLELLKLEAKG